MNEAQIYSVLFHVFSVSAVCFMAWCILKGASPWLVVPMIIIGTITIVPGKQEFKCPNCGHTGEMKTFSCGKYGLHVDVLQSVKGDD